MGNIIFNSLAKVSYVPEFSPTCASDGAYLELKLPSRQTAVAAVNLAVLDFSDVLLQ